MYVHVYVCTYSRPRHTVFKHSSPFSLNFHPPPQTAYNSQPASLCVVRFNSPSTHTYVRELEGLFFSLWVSSKASPPCLVLRIYVSMTVRRWGSPESEILGIFYCGGTAEETEYAAGSVCVPRLSWHSVIKFLEPFDPVTEL